MLRDVQDGGVGISKTRDTKGKGSDGRGTEELPEQLQHPRFPQPRVNILENKVSTLRTIDYT